MPELEELQQNMSTFYSLNGESDNVLIEDVAPGRFFAAHHSDGHWYRAKVVFVEDPDNVKIKFVDFGDIKVMAVKNLRHLRSNFRNLPMQAVKATLAGMFGKNKLDLA